MSISTIGEVLVEKCVRGRIIVSHVRLASPGIPVRKENIYPWRYRGWVLAHNGAIRNRQELPELIDRKYRGFEGSTDSEVFFHLIVQEAESLRDPVEGIRSAIEKTIANGVNFSSLNFIASDGRRLMP